MPDRIAFGVDHPPLIALFEPYHVGFGPGTSMVWREVGGKIVGGFAYNGVGAGTCHMHYVGAAPRWMTRRLLKAAFTYPFDELNITAILAFLPYDRLHARDVAIKLGFKSLGLIPGVDIHMLTMIRQDCRWLELNSRCDNG